ncbi:nuclear transport factor 2 family protein [uncultured Sulfitobacter sp.]|uniref:nuclear transport factor 2 family protein n=1 Tax=uncultured Sulfitobacter sp. TaxID=191468 RepID=UPI00262F6BA1|nr:nuclear transport factor 2 family protein [uncultured Sulfitobacter sp.]
MSKEDQVQLVLRYFAAVDREDLSGVLATLADDCVFSVETHGVRLEGHDAIGAMLERLWRNHEAVRHLDFTYVADPDVGRIAARFRVENTEHDGTITRKSNCNFFDVRNGKFSAVAVYMAGANTLNA